MEILLVRDCNIQSQTLSSDILTVKDHGRRNPIDAREVNYEHQLAIPSNDSSEKVLINDNAFGHISRNEGPPNKYVIEFNKIHQ